MSGWACRNASCTQRLKSLLVVADMVPRHYEKLYRKNKISLISALQSFVKNLSQIWLLKGDLNSLK